MTPPPEQRSHTDVAGLSIHARRWGDGPASDAAPVVLVHGLGVAGRMCRPVARLLAEGHAVYAPDLPGFGLSAKPRRVLDMAEHADIIAAWMRITGLGPAVVVGTSLGSQVTTELARGHPDLCRVLVLASPTVEAGRRTWRSQLLSWQIEQATQSLALKALQVADYARCGIRRVLRTFSLALEHHVEDVVVEVEAPVLVCWGTRDPLVSYPWAETVANRAPDGRLAVIPGALHALSHENPLELARVTRRFLSERLPAGSV